MTPTLAVVLSNIAYLSVAILAAVIGTLVVVMRHRKPKSVEANMESFHRGLQALAPERAVHVDGPEQRWGGTRHAPAPADTEAEANERPVRDDRVRRPPSGGAGTG